MKEAADSTEERRRSCRFTVTGRAYAIDNGCSGIITDINRTGLAFSCIDRKKRGRENGCRRLDICMDECEFYLAGIPVVPVSEVRVAGSGKDPLLVCKRLGCRFGDLEPAQEEKLEYFLRHYTSGCPDSF
ncbi:MAG: hypothetical protein AB1568_06530 [Thermodesulfobacteriota bacterium]